MKTVIVLAMHGIPPTDFPRRELAEFFKLHSMAEGLAGPMSQEVQDRYAVLHKRLRDWPRSRQNDPFHVASQELAAKLSEISGHEVIVGYNEFCSPSLDEALLAAVQQNADRIVVATTMMTRGGDHSEKDIPAAIKEFRESHPGTDIVYAWPFDSEQVARFLNDHLSRFS
jgi:sirohydrochlorin cobaltochelatase